MLFPFYLGVLHAVEPDHVAVVTGLALSGEPRGAWKVGLAFGASHMAAVALLAALAVVAGRTLFGEGFLLRLDQAAWICVGLLGLWNLAVAAGLAGPRPVRVHAHAHVHGALAHEHPHGHGAGHRFHHTAAWLGAFFGLGGVRGFTTLLRQHGIEGNLSFLGALLLFGLGITLTFILLSLASGWLARGLGGRERYHRALYGLSGLGNVGVALWLLAR